MRVRPGFGERVAARENSKENAGDAKIKTESETKTKVEHGEDKETHGKSEVKGDLSGLPFLGVKDVKMIAGACR